MSGLEGAHGPGERLVAPETGRDVGPEAPEERVLSPEEGYEVLRRLTSPLVAVTCRLGEKLNGMVANSAIRASLVPGQQRVALYVFKRHLTHEIMARTGRFVLHLLSRDQWDEIWALGFDTGRGRDKLDGLPYRLSREDGLPILTRCWAWMECRVINVMDTGSSTFFMGQALRMGRGSGGELMDSGYFREHMPEEWGEVYLRNLREAQRMSAAMPEMDDRPWRELNARAMSETG
ncbi:MAG: flavin reductase family protein [Gemmatimonadota bacterium]